MICSKNCKISSSECPRKQGDTNRSDFSFATLRKHDEKGVYLLPPNRYFSIEFGQNFYMGICRKGDTFTVSIFVNIGPQLFKLLPKNCGNRSDLSARPVPIYLLSSPGAQDELGLSAAGTTVLHPRGQRIVTHVPVGFCTKFGCFHPELRTFMNFSWVIVMHHFVSCSNVHLKIIVKYEDDHHIRDPLTRDLDFPIFFLIDFKF